MKINRAFIKGTNWALAGLISMLGFTGCKKEPLEEYGTPNADYTVKGAVVNKATGKPIEGIQVSYVQDEFMVMYSPNTPVTTNAKGEYKLTGKLFPDSRTLPVAVDDIDGEKNGLFKSDTLQVDFSNATHSGKQDHWYQGEYTVTVNVELTEIENQ